MGIVDHNNCINCRNEDYNYQRLKPNFGIVINAVDGGSNISGTLEGRIQPAGCPFDSIHRTTDEIGWRLRNLETSKKIE